MKRLRISDELAAAVDAARGDVPRDRWVARVLESAVAPPAPASREFGESLQSENPPELKGAAPKPGARPYEKPFKPLPKKGA